MNSRSSFNTFSTGRTSFGVQDFMDSNSIIAKMAFLVFAVFLFVLFMRIGISILSYFLKPTSSPVLINGMVDARNTIVFQQDPSGNDSAKTIYRSVNAPEGVEFTWSVWIMINDLNDGNGSTYKHIFSKGNSDLGSNGVVFPNNAPGLYIAPNSNSLVVIMNTFQVINEEVIIPGIPLNKWVNVLIRVKNTTMDVYVNGTITRSVELVGIPKQNYGNVYTSLAGGFNGYISNLTYYDYALGTMAIDGILSEGPNTKMIGTNGMADPARDYLSLRWYFFGVGDTYNPTSTTK